MINQFRAVKLKYGFYIRQYEKKSVKINNKKINDISGVELQGILKKYNNKNECQAIALDRTERKGSARCII